MRCNPGKFKTDSGIRFPSWYHKNSNGAADMYIQFYMDRIALGKVISEKKNATWENDKPKETPS